MPLRPELAGILDALVKNRCAKDLNKHKHTHTPQEKSTYNSLVV